MRTKKEIMKDIWTPKAFGLLVEVLLDIRDLLAHPPVTIEGRPIEEIPNAVPKGL